MQKVNKEQSEVMKGVTAEYLKRMYETHGVAYVFSGGELMGLEFEHD